MPMHRVLFGSMMMIAALTATLRAATNDSRMPIPRGPQGVPGVVIDVSPDPRRLYIGSPSLVILPGGEYVAAHDFFGPGTTCNRSAIFVSRDRGQTWRKLTELEGQWWSTLFVHQGALYLIGTSHEYGDVVIRRSTDGGRTWTTPRDDASGLLYRGLYHCAPVPVVTHHGRLWRAFEQSSDPQHPRAFESLVLSAAEDADLLHAASWTRTNNVKEDPAWLNTPGAEWLEGNVVVTSEGGLANILRINADCGRAGSLPFTGPAAGQTRYETAARLEISPDGKTLTFDPARGFIHLPGAESKFTIRYDPQSKRYWSLVQKITSFDYTTNNPTYQRNVLALTSSADLRQWRVDSLILRWNEGRSLSAADRVGFQYVDWVFDGADMVAACRTAWDGQNFHDANYLTFLRLPRFRDLTLADSPPDLAGSEPAGAVPARGFAVKVDELIYPLEDRPTPSCHASTLAQAADGTLVAAWFGGTQEQASDVGIWLARQEGGRWSPPREVAQGLMPDGRRYPCWNPVLFQPRTGPLQLYFKVGPDPATWWGEMMQSSDCGRTWHDRRRLPEGILGPAKNKPMQLADGTILAPSSDEADGAWRVHVERTRDLGQTWESTGPLPDRAGLDAIQPSILVHPAGRLQLLCRTRGKGALAESWSDDGGKSWSPLATTTLPNPNSGIDAITLQDGHHLLVCNPVTAGRTPLVVAVSPDGRQWKNVLTLEHEPGAEFSYPAVIQTADGLVHVTYTWKRQSIRHVVLDPQ